MRISDWSSDVCSSDLVRDAGMGGRVDRDHGNAMRLDPILQVPEAHEIGHDLIRWHAGMMLGDTEPTPMQACHEGMDAAANYAAGTLLFPASQTGQSTGGQ